jgi:hypothetical protein
MRPFLLTFLMLSALTSAGSAAIATGRDTTRHSGSCDANIYKMKSSNDVVMYLSGTTPVKDWKMVAHGLQGAAQFELSKRNQLIAINTLTLSRRFDRLFGCRKFTNVRL